MDVTARAFTPSSLHAVEPDIVGSMSRRAGHFATVAVAALLVLPAIVIACGAFGEDSPASVEPADAGLSEAAADAPVVGEAGACVNAHPLGDPSDLEGCDCKSEPARACAIAKTTLPSKCMAGTQTCKGNHWTACTGATAPATAETCDDNSDDDCDGVLNNGCRCTVSYDLCKTPDGGARPNVFVEAIPSMAKMGDTIELFIAYKGSIAKAPSVFNNTANYCPGQGGTGCMAGMGCTDWSGWRRSMKVEAPAFKASANNTLVVFINELNPPCENGPGAIKASVTVMVQ